MINKDVQKIKQAINNFADYINNSKILAVSYMTILIILIILSFFFV